MLHFHGFTCLQRNQSPCEAALRILLVRRTCEGWLVMSRENINKRLQRIQPFLLVLLVFLSCGMLLPLSYWYIQHGSKCDRPNPSLLARSDGLRHVRLATPSSHVESSVLKPLNSTNAEHNQLTAAAPPFHFPKLIHQTVINKHRLSCEEKSVIKSWKKLNPNYTHQLWDDNDIRQFMLQHYPELVPVPFDEFVKGTERSDLWRIMVLHKYGGIYADMDVQCLKPIDEWNAAHGHDAAVLLGTENFEAMRRPHRIHVTNWVLAATPGHPLLARVPEVVVRAIQKQYFALARAEKPLTAKLYEQGILDRTGPAALTTAMYEHFSGLGVDLNKFTEADINSAQGVVSGGVRILPVVAMSSGWEVAVARSEQQSYTCADVAAAKPQALVCHMFWGSWRSTWKDFEQPMTYGFC